jgi:hypothetical protein
VIPRSAQRPSRSSTAPAHAPGGGSSAAGALAHFPSTAIIGLSKSLSSSIPREIHHIVSEASALLFVSFLPPDVFLQKTYLCKPFRAGVPD